MQRKVISNNTVLHASLKGRLQHVLRHLLIALLFVLANCAPELLDPVDNLVQVAEIKVQDLLQHAQVACCCLGLEMLAERSPSCSAFSFRHVLQTVQCFAVRRQAHHVVELPTPLLLVYLQR